MVAHTAPVFQEVVSPLPSDVLHELNNLLMAVAGNAALLLTQGAESDPARTTLLALSKAANRAMDLIPTPGRPDLSPVQRMKHLDCREPLRDTVTLLRPLLDNGIEVVVRTPEGLWEAAGDPGKIGQVLMNLCLNARDAMPWGGVLTLEAENVHVGAPHFSRVGEASPGDYVRLRVADSGRGIAPEVLGHIYDPFFTTKDTGHGIGLAVVRDIVTQHRGWVDCVSEPDHGTRFDIFLPRAIDEYSAGREFVAEDGRPLYDGNN